MVGRIVFIFLGVACQLGALGIIALADSDRGVADGRGPDPAELGSAYVLALTGIGFMVAAVSSAIAGSAKARADAAGATSAAGSRPPNRVPLGPPGEPSPPPGPPASTTWPERPAPVPPRR